MKKQTLALAAVLALALVRLWLMPLPSSFWTDETSTAFVVRYGASRAATPLLPGLIGSVYYSLPRAAVALGGFSEAACRLPSTLAMGVALLLIGRLAARLIHPQAAWFAVFACLSLHGFNFQAADARPYGLGTAVIAAGVWFLVRWLDEARWRDAVLFVLFGALLLPVHPLYWPFYFVFAGYAAARLILKDTRVTWLRAGGVFAVLALAAMPVPLEMLSLARGARAYVSSPLPGAKALLYSLKPVLPGACLLGAWLFSRLCHRSADAPAPQRSSLALVAMWWLCPPVCLFAVSWLTGISVFVERYYSLALPGAALVGTALASRYVPSRMWKPLALAVGLGVLLLQGDWREAWPAHAHVDWRGAAHAINQRAPGPETPIICPSPVVETQAPLWRPGYPLPSFLYAPLAAYPVGGHVVPFPFATSPEAEKLAATLAQSARSSAARFFVYGHRSNTSFWETWFERRPELAGWAARRLGPFGDVLVVEFDPPATK